MRKRSAGRCSRPVLDIPCLLVRNCSKEKEKEKGVFIALNLEKSVSPYWLLFRLLFCEFPVWLLSASKASCVLL